MSIEIYWNRKIYIYIIYGYLSIQMAIDDHRCINIHRDLFWPVHPIIAPKRRCQESRQRVSSPRRWGDPPSFGPAPKRASPGQTWQGFMVKHGKHVEQFWKNDEKCGLIWWFFVSFDLFYPVKTVNLTNQVWFVCYFLSAKVPEMVDIEH